MAAWRQLGLTARQAYNCVEATRQMAGHNNTAQTEGLRSELTAKIQQTSDQLSARIESQGQELSAKGSKARDGSSAPRSKAMCRS